MNEGRMGAGNIPFLELGDDYINVNLGEKIKLYSRFEHSI